MPRKKKSADTDVLDDGQESKENFQRAPEEANDSERPDDAADDDDEEVVLDADDKGRPYLFDEMKPTVKKKLYSLGKATRDARDAMMDSNKAYRDQRDRLIDEMHRQGITEYALPSGETVRLTSKEGLKIETQREDVIDL